MDVERVVYIVKKGHLRQKYHGVFKAQGNFETLAHTENYVSRQSLVDMLTTYYPDWEIRG